ncbi:MAG: LON peptidase substrate-binding domain-containing protein [Saprospiraceae bacterium]|nr:LON peptidase substrate-binding domain-containing protein [Saprospiraceae bacterium]
MIVFPGEVVNLHIFEPRYQQLIRECRDEHIHFGIPPFINNKLMPLATEMELLEISKVHAKGEMDISVQALHQVKIHEYYPVAPDKLYPGGQCKQIPFDALSDPFLDQEIQRLLESILSQVPFRGKKPTGSTAFRMEEYVHLVGMNVSKMYEMYEANKQTDRQQLFLEHLRQIMPQVRQMEEMRQKVQMNGHFKNVIPPKI